MNVLFCCDEWYPVYVLAFRDGCSGFYAMARLKAEMTEEEYADFKDAYERFEKWQDILQERIESI